MKANGKDCTLQILDRGMTVAEFRNSQSAIRIHIPVWWRTVLVALATLILCSCQASPFPAGQRPLVVAAGDGQLAVGGLARSGNRVAAYRKLDIPASALVSNSKPLYVDTDRGLRRVGEAEIASDQPDASVRPASFQTAAPRPSPNRTRESASEPRTLPEMPSSPAALPRQPAAANSCDTCATGACAMCGSSPMVGPSDEYLCDGGDFGLPVGVRADWTVDGLEQEDTVAHYDTLDGRVVVTPTNRVCIYAPRFAAVRRVVSATAHERQQLVETVDDELGLIEADEKTPVATSLQRYAASTNLADRPPSMFRGREQAGSAENLQGLIEVFGGLAPYCDLSVIRTGQFIGDEKPLVEKAVQSAITWTGDQAVQVVFENKQAVAAVQVQQAGVVYRVDEPNSPRLRVIKLASTGNALPGEEVEFTLRFDNIGDQTIGNVTIVDNLATRLEYVADSAKGSIDMNFDTEPNGAGSAVLRFEILEPVEPGEGGVLQFTARVR